MKKIIICVVLFFLFNIPTVFPIENNNFDIEKNDSILLSDLALKNCIDLGGILETKPNEDGKEYGICIIAEGKECSEFELLSGECNIDSSLQERFCMEKGGRIVYFEIKGNKKDAKCIFGKNMECQVDAMYKGDCPVGGIDISTFDSEESKYCTILGNTYIYKGLNDEGKEVGACRLKSGKIFDSSDYYLKGEFDSEENQIICPTFYSPVCGKDSKTYSNDCEATRVGIKYKGRCLSDSIEKKLKDAWEISYSNYKFDDGNIYNAILLEKLILKYSELSYTSDSLVRQSSFSYLSYLSSKALIEDYFYPYINNNFEKILGNDEPELTTNIDKIDWLSQNIAEIYYNDGNIFDSIKINISVKNGKYEIKKLEKQLIISHKYFDKLFNFKIKIPNSWDGKYFYRFSNSSNRIDFYYNAKREDNKKLFSINIYKKEEWHNIVNSGEINNFILKNLGEYVISYSTGLNAVYKNDENISNYSIMTNEIFYMLHGMKVFFK